MRWSRMGTFTCGGGEFLSPFVSAKRRSLRRGHNYTLADRITNGRTCPPSGDNDCEFCHNLDLGLLNSTHFGSQAERMYNRYHSLAVSLQERECRRLHTALQDFSTDIRDDYVGECELLAASLEGVAGHYLQDRWSMGHMWERWGSPRMGDFGGDRGRALLVGAYSGIVHGAQRLLGRPDRMCAPFDPFLNGDQVTSNMFDLGGLQVPGAGDIYLPLPLSDPRFAAQRERMLACNTSSWVEVRAAGPDDASGEYSVNPSVDPTSGSCWSHYATNAAMRGGSTVDNYPLPNLVRDPVSTTIGAYFIFSAVWWRQGRAQDIPLGHLREDFRRALLRWAGFLRANEKTNPMGTQSATLGGPEGRFAFLAAEANDIYAASPEFPPAYVEPSLDQWGETLGAHEGVDQLRLAYHRANMRFWCDERNLPKSTLDAFRQRCAASADPAVGDCKVCEEFVLPLMSSCDPGSPVENHRSMCEALGVHRSPAQSVRIPRLGLGQKDLASMWCHSTFELPASCEAVASVTVFSNFAEQSNVRIASTGGTHFDTVSAAHREVNGSSQAEVAVIPTSYAMGCTSLSSPQATCQPPGFGGFGGAGRFGGAGGSGSGGAAGAGLGGLSGAGGFGGAGGSNLGFLFPCEEPKPVIRYRARFPAGGIHLAAGYEYHMRAAVEVDGNACTTQVTSGNSALNSAGIACGAGTAACLCHAAPVQASDLFGGAAFGCGVQGGPPCCGGIEPIRVERPVEGYYDSRTGAFRFGAAIAGSLGNGCGFLEQATTSGGPHGECNAQATRTYDGGLTFGVYRLRSTEPQVILGGALDRSGAFPSTTGSANVSSADAADVCLDPSLLDLQNVQSCFSRQVQARVEWNVQFN